MPESYALTDPAALEYVRRQKELRNEMTRLKARLALAEEVCRKVGAYNQSVIADLSDAPELYAAMLTAVERWGRARDADEATEKPNDGTEADDAQG